MLQITAKTKIDDLLKEYPQLEEFLIGLNPKYKKLKNPILRRTVAKIATLTQVAKIGGYKTVDLVNILRKEVGQPPLEESGVEKDEQTEETPSWIEGTPVQTIDANKLLDEEKNPLSEVSKVLKKIESGDIVVIKSDFLPSPLIDTFREQGYEVYAAEAEEGLYLTYIRKP
ncbi:hypothetical protein NNO_0566 [Hydrogenimonas sp.]|nr:hypothetical protein NNO_0566 [Hydrogenimonas sp.]